MGNAGFETRQPPWPDSCRQIIMDTLLQTLSPKDCRRNKFLKICDFSYIMRYNPYCSECASGRWTISPAG